MPNGEPERCPCQGISDARLSCKDNESFEALFEKYYLQIRNYCRYRVRSLEEADEIAVDVFAYAWRHISETSEWNLRPWLFQIAQREISNQWRSRSRRKRLFERLRNTAAELHEDRTDDFDEESPAVVALRRLRPADQEVLSLIALDGLTTKEAAAILRCTVHAVTNRLYRAKIALRNELADHR